MPGTFDRFTTEGRVITVAAAGDKFLVQDISEASGDRDKYIVYSNLFKNVGTVYGGQLTTENLQLYSNALKDGKIKLGDNSEYDETNKRLGINKTTPLSILHLGTATEELEFVDAGSTGATQQDWIEVEVGGVVGYIHVYASK